MFASFDAREPERFVSSGVGTLFGRKGGTPLQPRRIVSVYYPAWIIDAEMISDVSIKHPDRIQKLNEVRVQLDHTYMPGNEFEPLGRLSMNFDHTDIKYLPWSESLKSQYGDKVHCLPYTMSPMDLASSFRHRQASFTVPHKQQSQDSTPSRQRTEFTIDPEHITYNYFVAYPLLIPIYLSEYESPSGPFTLILEGHTDRIYSTQKNSWTEENDMFSDHSLMKRLMERVENDVPTFANGALLARSMGIWTSFSPANIRAILQVPEKTEALLEEVLELWISRSIEKRAVKQSAKIESGEAREVDMSNPLIREYDEEERESAMEWMDQGQLLYGWDTITKMRNAKQLLANPPLTPEPRSFWEKFTPWSVSTKVDDAKEILENYALAKREREVSTRPQWLQRELKGFNIDLLGRKEKSVEDKKTMKSEEKDQDAGDK
ncbi:hypothetical protein BV25DRAFT_1910915 [Artomyces pyxidatus]|uniref:Uncharacterized protein n=1 Tax=Artomyces pyxidatus TaxID=48021 RepID=A0ACB8TLA9_9AGAM|nr:hypothetical protein BV25DRAFT_1910915 [Artomyces pyxidatus]